MKLYNSLSHTKEDFIPREEGKVSMYTCGPTVYHFAHIGNLRSYIMEDVLEKYLRFAGNDVKRVMNITDVGHLTSDGDTGDDKMLKGAKREHKTVMEIADFYTKAFFADCAKLNIRTPDVVEPATSCIDEFIRVIASLIEKGYAYEAGGNIYFDTSKLKEYYVFGDVSEDDLEVGVREGVEEDGNKRNKADFVLWFTKSKFDDQELKWDSPWGIGYPGWHIECSCISMKNLGEYLDLHCGGIDNAFPHHTNEIAQSEAYLGHEWCKYWFHVHHLNTTGGKMSKSKGEFLTVSLLEEKGYDPLVYRFFCLQSHYRKSLVFSYENLDNAAAAYGKLIARTAQLLKEEQGQRDDAAYEKLMMGFTEALDNDLNTSLAVTALFDVLKADTNGATKLALINEFDKVLSLDIVKAAEKLNAAAEQAQSDIPAEVMELAEQRKAARKEKNFALADELRDRISALGYVIEETRQGTKISKK
ncbi:MAG: cysteine--tRNA ligase [Huintestinicola sp.]